MKKAFITSLCLTFMMFFALTACSEVTPTVVPLLASITPVPVTNTPKPQPTEAIVSMSTQTIAPSNPTLDIGSTMMGSDAMTLLYVPAGKFTMGSNYESPPESAPSYYDFHPQHSVTLNAFWIDQTEVTNKQYALCVLDKACVLPLNLKSPMRSTYYGNPEFDNYPVIYIEWGMAKSYCEWAGRRLPTEAEWEKAARGIDGRIYPWGNATPNDSLLNYDSPIRDTTEVGKYLNGQSPYGALDMAGNVWEWVNDWFGTFYYQTSPSLNPIGPESGQPDTMNARGLRGGSWYFENGHTRSIFRYGVVPVDFLVRADVRSWAVPVYEDTSIYNRTPHGFGTVGFRCAMSATP